MKTVLLSDYDVRLGEVLPFLDPARFRYAVADFQNPALAMAEFDCIVPFQLKDYFDLWARGDLERINCLIPSREVMELLDNKYECNRFLAARGFGAYVPAMLGNEDVARLDAWPIIYKKKYDAYGTQAFLCYSRAELEAIEAATVQTEYFRQEYVPGEVEYATHMLSVAGRVAYHSTFRYTFDTPHFVKGARWKPPPPEMCECPCAPRLAPILGELDYTGTSCFNYKMVAGVPKIFEINPRFGQSLARDINNYLDAYIGVTQGIAARR
jgi:carbamoylphosphate synthase large subunit